MRTRHKVLLGTVAVIAAGATAIGVGLSSGSSQSSGPSSTVPTSVSTSGRTSGPAVVPSPVNSADGIPRPDPNLTPGAIIVTATVAQVCVPGYSATVRNVPQSEKDAVYVEYHRQDTPGGNEVDHLISLELGGSNDITNLWPEPYMGKGNAHLKDALENKLHRLVCATNPTLTLADAQRMIASDWVVAYVKYVGPLS